MNELSEVDAQVLIGWIMKAGTDLQISEYWAVETKAEYSFYN